MRQQVDLPGFVGSYGAMGKCGAVRPVGESIKNTFREF